VAIRLDRDCGQPVESEGRGGPDPEAQADRPCAGSLAGAQPPGVGSGWGRRPLPAEATGVLITMAPACLVGSELIAPAARSRRGGGRAVIAANAGERHDQAA